MRLLHVTPSYLPATRYGGPIYSVHALCRSLVRLGHDVHVYTTNVDGAGVSAVPLNAPVDIDGVAVSYFAAGLGRRLYHAPNMIAALARRAGGFDMVHSHSVFLWPTTAAARAARRHGVPHVMSPRGMLVAELIRRKSRIVKSAWISLFERRNLAEAAAVHATSRVEAEAMHALGLSTGRVVTIANGIDLPPPEAPATRAASDAPPRPMLLFLGRINWKKGLDRLVAAMAQVPASDLVIAGNDEEGYRPRLEALACEYGVAPRVRFVGAVRGPDKWRLLRSADVFVLPSYNENFGNAVLEAMACGVPVVVTPQVGLADAVRATGAGLVSAGDPDMLGAALTTLLNDAPARRRMGTAGQRAAAEQFSWTAIASEFEGLYQEIAAARVKVAARERATALIQ